MAFQQRTVCQLLLFLLAYGFFVLLTSLASMTPAEDVHILRVSMGKTLLQQDKEAFLKYNKIVKRSLPDGQEKLGKLLQLAGSADKISSNNQDGLRVKQKACLPKLTVQTKKKVFQPVDHSTSYIYSAYLDEREVSNPAIRIIGIGTRTDKQHYYCLLKYPKGEYVAVPAISRQMYVDNTLHGGFKYLPYFYTCNVTSNIAPKSVSLTSKPCVPPKNSVPVVKVVAVPEQKVPDKIGLCLRTLHSVKSPYVVIEFLEIQKQLGVDKVFLYGIENATNDVGRVLDYYIGLGYIEVVPWVLPVSNAANFWQKGDIAIHGQRASNNDCLYRNINKYKVLLMHDLDEYFIPRSHSNIRSLLNHLDEDYASNSRPAAYEFKNCYFCLKDQDVNNTQPQLLTLEKVIRDDCMPRELAWTMKHHPELKHRETNRTVVKKALIYAHRVVEMGVHGVVSTIPGYTKQEWVPADQAAMHHYKKVQGVECHRLDQTMVNNFSSNTKLMVNKVIRTLGMRYIR